MLINKMLLTTDDGAKIAANLYLVEKPLGWLILTHMMPATKESWRGFAGDLQNLKYESIAIDLRGHGESSGGPDRFLNFSDLEHQKSILDLKVAVNYLMEKRGATPDRISFIGASIGANLSLQYVANPPADEQEFKTAILLSPGLNYRGIKTEPLVKKLQIGQRVFFVSAKDDERSGGNNAEMNQKLYDLTPTGVEKKIQIYETGGHGTDILENQPKLKNLIIEFLK